MSLGGKYVGVCWWISSLPVDVDTMVVRRLDNDESLVVRGVGDDGMFVGVDQNDDDKGRQCCHRQIRIDTMVVRRPDDDLSKSAPVQTPALCNRHVKHK